MTIYNNSVLDPPKFLRPCINISPFQKVNSVAPSEDYSSSLNKIEDYFFSIYPDMRLVMTHTGRAALKCALCDLRLRRSDEVAILTTSGNYYVSSCVTDTIESVCKWTRHISACTSAVVVIDEFGFPFKELKEVIGMGIPVIEDRAHGFFLDDRFSSDVDYVVYSFPKALPVQLGGALLIRQNSESELAFAGDEFISYIARNSEVHFDHISDIKEKRISNYCYFSKAIEHFGMSVRFSLEDGVVPGVFMFNTTEALDLDRMKLRFQANGVEASIFYKEKAFFFPVHQNLSEGERELILNLIRSCLEGNYGDF